MILRDYQDHAVNAVFNYFNTNSGNPLVLMPTGTGKSVVIADFCKRALITFPQTKILIGVHVETLISQNHEKLLKHWPTAPAGIYSAGLNRRDTFNQIIFAGIQSVFDRALEFGFVDLFLIDEAHLVSPHDETMYRAFINGLKAINPNLKVIGLTATGWRLGLGCLTDGGIFTDIAIDMTTPEAWNWFIDCGYLAPLYAKQTKLQIDITGVKTGQNGDFVLSGLQDAVDKEMITRQACQEMIYHGNEENKKCWLIFATGVEHCEHIAEILNEYGVSAVAIHSKTKNPQDLLKDFENGKYRCAVSMNKLTTGIDIPHIDLIGILRHTKSSALWVQMLGRGTRPCYAEFIDVFDIETRLNAIRLGSKPNGTLVLDFAANTERLGPINNPLIPLPKGKRKTNVAGTCPVWTCPQCSSYIHASKRKCDFVFNGKVCGFERAVNLKISGEAGTAQVMTRDIVKTDPIVELIEIERVTYAVHKKRNSEKPPSLRVSYYAKGAFRKYEEYIGFEHDGMTGKKAAAWFRERVPGEHRQSVEPPKTTLEAQKLAQFLLIPQRIRVWINLPYPKIVGYEY